MWSVESEYEFIAVKEKMPSKETDPEILQISSFLSLYYLVNEAENPPKIGQVSILAFIAFTGKVHEKGRGLSLCHKNLLHAVEPCFDGVWRRTRLRESTVRARGAECHPGDSPIASVSPNTATRHLRCWTESVSFIRRKTGVIQLNPKLIWQMSCFSRVGLCDSQVVSMAGVIGL